MACPTVARGAGAAGGHHGRAEPQEEARWSSAADPLIVLDDVDVARRPRPAGDHPHAQRRARPATRQAHLAPSGCSTSS
ncbi:hypothetical protein QJS66_12590 [Kocuria rhizophila]|nr:hypothetical protein QJS66_12590 [Kocuria rhizophila]